MWMFVLLCVLIILLWYRSTLSTFSYWRKQGVIHPDVSLLFGNLKEVVFLQKSTGDVYHEIYQTYSSLPYVGLYKMRTPGILLRDPELIQSVLITNFGSFSENDVDIKTTNDPFVDHTPFFTNGAKWKESRSQVLPSLTAKQMKLYFPIIREVAARLIRYLEDPVIANGGIEVKKLCEKFSMDAIAESVVGLNAHSFETHNSDFVKAGKQLFQSNFFAQLKLMFNVILPHVLKTSLIPKDTVSYFTNIVNETMTFRQTNKLIRNDFLNTMMDLQKKLGDQKLPNEVITGHAISFLIDGFEAISRLLSYTLYQLAKNVGFQTELRAEIETKAKLEENNSISYELLEKIVLLDNCLNEAMRLHPPLMFMGKKSTKSFSLPPLTPTGKSVTLPPGMSIIIPLYSLHYDPNYFSDPTTFNPHRFSEYNNIQKCTFLPFGEGPRACIGQKFGLGLVKTALIYILLNYDIRLNEKTKTPLQIQQFGIFVTVQGDLWLNFTKR